MKQVLFFLVLTSRANEDLKEELFVIMRFFFIILHKI